MPPDHAVADFLFLPVGSTAIRVWKDIGSPPQGKSIREREKAVFPTPFRPPRTAALDIGKSKIPLPSLTIV